MTPRTITAAALLVLEAGLAVLGVVVHYGLTAEYGDVTDSPLAGLGAAFSGGVGVVALVIVGVAAIGALVASTRRWLRLTAAAVPALMVVGMLAVTPAALQRKLEVQYDATPQCVSVELDSGPGARAARDSQQAFESIGHVGYFGGAGSSGVGGCDRSFVLRDDVDVLQHYRGALVDAGWRVVEDDVHHLRARRGGMEFEVRPCGRAGGVVWAGRSSVAGGAACPTQ
jgi:hypothetical protein